MAKTNRRNFLTKGAAVAALTPVAAKAAETPTKKVIWPSGKRPEKPLFSPVVTFGDLVFVSGIGAHFQGDVKAHTAKVLEDMETYLKAAGSSMEKVLKVSVFLNDIKDWEAMNTVFIGKFGPEPPVRTTVAPAGGIPGGSLVEMDCIAYK